MSRVQVSQRLNPTKAAVTEARDGIALSKSAQFMKTMIEWLYEAYEIDHYRTVFRNRRGSYHWRPKGRHQLVFGYSGLLWYIKSGYQDYRTIHPLIAGLKWRKPNGLEAAYYLAIHEFAHVLQTEVKNGRTYGSAHNWVFINKYRELLSLVSFEDAVVEFAPRSTQLFFRV